MVLIHPTIDWAASTLLITVPAHGSTCESTHSISLFPPTDPAAHEYDFTIWGSAGLDGYVVGSADLTAALSGFLGRQVLLVQKGEVGRLAGPDEGWIEQLAPSGLVTSYHEPSTINWPDQFPILLISKASLAALDEMIANDPLIRSTRGFDVERWTGEPHAGIEAQRFRGNIVVEGDSLEAFEEESWGEVELGEQKETMFVAARCARCMLPNVGVEGEGAGVRDKVVPDLVLRPRDTFDGRVTWKAMCE